MDQPKLTIKAETRKRCHVELIDQETLERDYMPLSTEFFHFLYEVPTIDFCIFFRVNDEMITYITPNQFSVKLLNDMKHGSECDTSGSTEIYIKKDDEEKYENLLEQVCQRKIDIIHNTDKTLDHRLLELVTNISLLGAKVVKGGISPLVAKNINLTVNDILEDLIGNKTLLTTLLRILQSDPTLYEHSSSVGMIGGIIGRQILHLSEQDVSKIVISGIYHDIGKTCVPRSISLKDCKLTGDELEIMKTHTSRGFEELNRAIGKGAKIDLDVAKVSLEHHERFAGHGYPLGRCGRFEEDTEHGIHIYSRVIAIADVFSAMLIEKSYKPAYSPEEAIKIMSASAENDYDPVIVQPFIKTLLTSFAKLKEGGHHNLNYPAMTEGTLVYDTSPKKSAA